MGWIDSLLGSPWVLGGWLVSAALSLGVLGRDIARNNPELPGVMKLVWLLTVAYSGPLGLAVYFYAGRRQIADDTLWRRGFRSVAHCYSGCGAGEVIGVVLAAGLFSLGNYWTSAITFALAYAFGIALTVKPLLDDGERFGTAMRDAVISESASIVVMEAVAIAVDLLLARTATIGEVAFWSSLVVSLTAGLVAAYPVNVLLIQRGVKEGMHDPRQRAAGTAS